MTTITPQQALAFVEAVTLGQPSAARAVAPGAPAADDQGPSFNDNDEVSYVDDGSLIAFVSGVSSQHKQDAINSTLFAQLYANAKYDRLKDGPNWYNAFQAALLNIGWDAQGFNLQQVQSGGSTFQVDKVVLTVLEAIATGNDLAVVTAAIKGLESLSDGDSAMKIWQQATASAQAANFQIGACSDSDGTLVMKIGGFFLSGSDVTTRFLWATFSSSSVSMLQASQTMVLDDQVYRAVRKLILQKLGKNARDFVFNAPLKK